MPIASWKSQKYMAAQFKIQIAGSIELWLEVQYTRALRDASSSPLLVGEYIRLMIHQFICRTIDVFLDTVVHVLYFAASKHFNPIFAART